ncbi:MAG: hypothetical protein J2P24_16225, partial [Streptosporangiales bacterium]|nr:hypothetical protein [Streptosporangiales bacterium]
AASALLALVAAAPAAAAPSDRPIAVTRGHDAQFTIQTSSSGESLLDLDVAAPGVDWADKNATSAVVSLYVDGRYDTDVVVTGSEPVARQFALGSLSKGGHHLRLHFADDRSSPAATSVNVTGVRASTYAAGTDDGLALRYAPVLYGRNLAELGGPNESATTDTPLIAWHEATPASTPGHTVLTYSIVWSNEDGGTDTPALMARWGRTTDIEWVYQLEVDQNGDRVPGSDVYQAANHETLHFAGRYEGDHAVLETCTSNNNMCDTVDDPMRFFLSALQTRPADQAREHLMDVNPWTYQVMAKEMIREGKIEPPTPDSAATPLVSDQRNYLYAVVKKTTNGANGGSSWVGVALGVTLANGSTVYMSNHDVPSWSIQRDDPAATTVELPPGTTADDVVKVTAYRVVNGTDTGATVDVTALQRGFLLGQDYLPQQSFLSWSGDARLSAAQPSAVLWTR